MQTDWHATHITPRCSPAFAHALQAESAACFRLAADPAHAVQYVCLVSVGGYNNRDLPMSGQLQETPHLQNSPHLRRLLAHVTPALGRVCLVRNAGGQNTSASANPLYQNDAHPLLYQTNIMPLGEDYCLLAEIRREKPGVDTAILFAPDVLAVPSDKNPCLNLTKPQLDILSPRQINSYLDTVQTHSAASLTAADQYKLTACCTQFLTRWQRCHAQFGHDYSGEWSYQSALNAFDETIIPLVQSVTHLLSEQPRQEVQFALKIISTQLNLFPPAPRRVNRAVLLKARRRKQFSAEDINEVPDYQRPIFIVSAPRAGSTLLFETLSQFSELWSTGEENHALLEDLPGLHPRDHGFDSNRLSAADATADIKSRLLRAFTRKLQNREQHYYLDSPAAERAGSIRFLEKTPKNALRIPFIKALFPDALFVYLYRSYPGNISSLVDGWRSKRFIAYRNLPGFENRHWSFLLIPGWRELHKRSIADIAAQQWQVTNQIIRQDLRQLPQQDWMQIDYHQLITQPAANVCRFAEFAGLKTDKVVRDCCSGTLPVSRLTLSSPQQDKWKKHQYFLPHFPPRDDADHHPMRNADSVPAHRPHATEKF